MQELFRVFGGGPLGAKVDDLIRFEPILTKQGLRVLGGDVIAMEIYRRLLAQSGADMMSDATALKAGGCPEFLREINLDILADLPEGSVLAVRSSADGDSAGRGVYATRFMVLGRDVESNQVQLWNCEAEVYASCLSSNAKIWQLKTGNRPEMAILVQVVHGIWLDGLFLPKLAGTAYTSYQGLPLLQVVKGLGTRAVRGQGIGFNVLPEDFDFVRALWNQQEVDALTEDGTLAKIDGNYEQMFPRGARETLCKAMESLSIAKSQLGNLYLEWAWESDRICVLQCAEYQDSLSDGIELDPEEYFLLTSAKDVNGKGRAEFKAVVLASAWSYESAQLLEHLNRELSDYLLIVPEMALSGLADSMEDHKKRVAGKIQLKHFSNASCLVEVQKGWTADQIRKMKEMRYFAEPKHIENNLGACHFRQVCKDLSVLYVGGKFDAQKILALPGAMDYRGHLRVWLVDGIVAVDSLEGQGSVYLSKRPVVLEYAPSQIEKWSIGLRQTANQLVNSHTELSTSYYMVHYAIAPDSVLATRDYDPYRLGQEIVDECGGLAGFRRHLQNVISQGSCMVDEEEWNAGLENYLRTLDLRVAGALVE